MKAVFCEKLGTPNDLVVREIDPPDAPGSGQIKVWINARGVSFTDVLMAAGEYQVKPELPMNIEPATRAGVEDVYRPPPEPAVLLVKTLSITNNE